MAYAFQDDIIGMPPMRTIDAAPRSPAYLGMLGHALDPTLGGGEFMYLQGVNGLVQGSLVAYNQLSGATTLSATGMQGNSPVAVAMAAPQTGQYGWFQVSGNALIAKTAGAAISLGGSLAVSATGGQIAAGAAGGGAGTLDSAVCSSAALTTDVVVNATISRPMVN